MGKILELTEAVLLLLLFDWIFSHCPFLNRTLTPVAFSTISSYTHFYVSSNPLSDMPDYNTVLNDIGYR